MGGGGEEGAGGGGDGGGDGGGEDVARAVAAPPMASTKMVWDFGLWIHSDIAVRISRFLSQKWPGLSPFNSYSRILVRSWLEMPENDPLRWLKMLLCMHGNNTPIYRRLAPSRPIRSFATVHQLPQTRRTVRRRIQIESRVSIADRNPRAGTYEQVRAGIPSCCGIPSIGTCPRFRPGYVGAAIACFRNTLLRFDLLGCLGSGRRGGRTRPVVSRSRIIRVISPFVDELDDRRRRAGPGTYYPSTSLRKPQNMPRPSS